MGSTVKEKNCIVRLSEYREGHLSNNIICSYRDEAYIPQVTSIWAEHFCVDLSGFTVNRDIYCPEGWVANITLRDVNWVKVKR